VRNGCGNRYLSKGMAIESEVADTEGSTATCAPPKKIRNVLCAFLCVPTHNGTRDREETEGKWQ
jgi:hypothetical protein